MKNQHFNRRYQQFFAFRSKNTKLFLREDGINWTLNIELAQLFLGKDGRIEIDDINDHRFTHVDELEPVEVIPNKNGTVKFNIQNDTPINNARIA